MARETPSTVAAAYSPTPSPAPSLPDCVGRKGPLEEVTSEPREPCTHMPDMPCSESFDLAFLASHHLLPTQEESSF